MDSNSNNNNSKLPSQELTVDIVDGKHWPTTYQPINYVNNQTETVAFSYSHPNKNTHQRINVQLYRDRHNIPSDIKLSREMLQTAYIGNVEFSLPADNTTHSINPNGSGKKFGYYPDPFTAVLEVLKTVKGSSERRALIMFMINEGLVPCKENCMYTLIEQATNNGINVLLNKKWNKRSSSVQIKRKLKVQVPESRRSMLCQVGNVYFHLPVNGKVYTKREALYWIAKTKKCSNERGAMMQFMVQEGYVPCQMNCLQELVRRTEVHRMPVGSDEWGRRGHPTKIATGYKNISSEKLIERNIRECIKEPPNTYYVTPDRFSQVIYQKNVDARERASIRYDDRIFGRGMKSSFELQPISELAKEELLEYWDKKINGEPAIRKSVLDRKGWKDSIVLQNMIPMKFCDDLEDLNHYPKLHRLDICSYIGYSVDYPRCTPLDKILVPEFVHDDSLDRTYRLYFDKRNYPPPTNLDDGGNSIEFVKLKCHIREVARVFCNGGKDERVFTCNSNYNKREHNQPSCPFGFTVKWDKYGFYIDLLSNPHKYTCRGCPWHCCKG